LELAVERNRPKIKLGEGNRRIEEVEKIKLKLGKTKSKLVTSVKQKQQTELEHKKHTKIVTSVKQALYATTTRPPSLKSRPKKVGINEDEIKLLEDIMEVITTNQKKCLMDAGAKKEDVDVLVKSSFYLVGPPGVPPTTIMH
jgi:flagellar biosynthesis GTPase FlhF